MSIASAQDESNARSPAATRAHVLPFLAFMGLLALRGFSSKLAADFGDGPSNFWMLHAEFWVYPLQVFVCGALLALGWRHYEFRWKQGLGVALAAGVLVFALWIAPGWLPGAQPRLDGFDPGLLADRPALQAASVALRFVRLVVIVPLLEEIFWRGFLMRYLIWDQWRSVAFGSFALWPFLGVAVLFALAHAGPDFPAALATGLIYNAIACRTRSLGACVIAHALTNLLLGLFILRTGQWGYW